jgi:hypothetical protein
MIDKYRHTRDESRRFWQVDAVTVEVDFPQTGAAGPPQWQRRWGDALRLMPVP